MKNKDYTRKSFRTYFREVRSKYLTHGYTEGTYRTPFENFIKSFSPNIRLIQEPKRTKGLGAPDFKAFYLSQKVGFIETKDLDTNLDDILESEQLKKYIEGINNLILTNYCRFMLIRNGQKIFDFNLFTPADLDNPRFAIPDDDKIGIFIQLMDEFFNYKLLTILSADELAKELSKKAKLLKDFAKEQLEEDLKTENGMKSSIYDFHEGIKELIKDISIEDCADAYAQTVTYGLFLARKNCKGELERINATYYIPKNVGIIKKIFINMSGNEFPSNISWIIDDIVDILNAADLDEILKKINIRGKKDKDPIIFFYEDFLNFYEPEKRKHMGVYYTPRPVVNFIVNSINSILKKYFDKPIGFAEDDVHVLDPGIGTGTFFWIAFLVVLNELKNAGLSGLIYKRIENHLLKHFYGFEILITPYVISHLKLTDLLERWHYNFKEKDRLQVYLTNTIEPSEIHGLMPFFRELTEESRIANEIKIKKPILVVMGNPPYSISSSNKSKWIMGKMQDYKKNLKERNIQPLDDDYIKFIRFAQWKIEQNGEGIVGYITNNSYLDGIIHRQMRKDLLDTFDRIYILNLHGDSRKKETCPDGSKDENVFDIQQGVAIALFIKNSKFNDKKVFYKDLYGKKEHKYKWLDTNRINNIKWKELKLIDNYYFFVQKDFALSKKYEPFCKIDEIFKLGSSGVTTSRDYLVVDFNDADLKSKLNKIKTKNFSLLSKHLNKDLRRKEILEILKKHDINNNLILPYYYRPFDKRNIYYFRKLIDRDRIKVMSNFLAKENLGLILRKNPAKRWKHVFISNILTDGNLLGARTYLFPLYLYNKRKEKLQHKNLNGENLESKLKKQLNFTEEFIEFIDKQYPNQKMSPEDIFYYIYAALHSPTYRKKYEEFLKYDFPRIPFVDDYEKFRELSKLGKKLVELHLMKKKLPLHTKFDVQGSNIVKKVKYKDGKVFINRKQYFDGIQQDVWNFYIGGYQVLDKWLKSRKNRELSGKEIEHFLQIVEIIKETIIIMKEIDKEKIV